MRDSGLLDAIDAVLVACTRVAEGREAEPAAGIIESQSVKTTEARGPCGYDAGKKIKGRQRHIVTDTAGTLLDGLVAPADIQDRNGAPELIERCRDAYPLLFRLLADGGYAGVGTLDDCDGGLQLLSIASSSCPVDGWSSARSPGAIDADASPKTGRRPSPPPQHGS